MIKYFGIALLPLLVVYWWLQTRRLTPHLAAFVLPLVAFALSSARDYHRCCSARPRADATASIPVPVAHNRPRLNS